MLKLDDHCRPCSCVDISAGSASSCGAALARCFLLHLMHACALEELSYHRPPQH